MRGQRDEREGKGMRGLKDEGHKDERAQGSEGIRMKGTRMRGHRDERAQR